MARVACVAVLLAKVSAQSPICMARHCASPMLHCGLDLQCIKAMLCFAKCGKDNSCDFECEQEAYGNERLKKFMQCSADNECLAKLEPDCFPAASCRHGSCNATDAESVQSLTSLEQLQGEWWTVTGVNPHYDYYPCQHEHIFQMEGQWINNSTYGIKSADQHLASVMNLTLLAPGVVQHFYTDAALSPNVEVWRFVSMPHPDWAFVLWCGSNPILHYSGGFVLSRHRDFASMPADVKETMQADLQPFGLDLDALKVMDNSVCTITEGLVSI